MTPEFFADYQRIFLTFHLLGVVIGMGCATVADILFFNFLKDFKITKKEKDIMALLSNIIMAAMLVLFVTGFALYLSDVPRFSASSAFFAKTLIVAVLTVNGVLMHSYIAPRMMHISFIEKEFSPKHVMHKLRAIAFAMGAVSCTSWYSVFFLAMLKSYIPPSATHGQILGAYLLILVLAVVGSQVMQKMYHRKYLFSRA